MKKQKLIKDNPLLISILGRFGSSIGAPAYCVNIVLASFLVTIVALVLYGDWGSTLPTLSGSWVFAEILWMTTDKKKKEEWKELSFFSIRLVSVAPVFGVFTYFACLVGGLKMEDALFWGAFGSYAILFIVAFILIMELIGVNLDIARKKIESK